MSIPIETLLSPPVLVGSLITVLVLGGLGVWNRNIRTGGLAIKVLKPVLFVGLFGSAGAAAVQASTGHSWVGYAVLAAACLIMLLVTPSTKDERIYYN